MNICIGIVSYFPDDIKQDRYSKLNSLINQCNELLNLPIIIIAQNWGDLSLQPIDSQITILKYKNGLGITGARRALRNAFLSSLYDYMIMLDDDILLTGDKSGFDLYLSELRSNPHGYCKFKNLTLLLFAISKEVYSKIDFPHLDPVNGLFFEDMWLIMTLEKHNQDLELKFTRGKIDAVANAVNDTMSTWYHGLFNKHHMGDNTRAMVRENR